MSDGEYTPTPWMVSRNTDKGLVWVDSFDAPSCGVADLYHRHGIGVEDFVAKDNAEANAAFIVKACNAHDELVEVVRAQHQAIDWLMATLIQKTHALGEPSFYPSKSPVWPAVQRGAAALAKLSEGLPTEAARETVERPSEAS